MQRSSSLKNGLKNLSEANCIGHEPCPKCGSKDNLGRYSDGGGHCFGCEYHEFADTSLSTMEKPVKNRSSVGAGDEYAPIRGDSQEL